MISFHFISEYCSLSYPSPLLKMLVIPRLQELSTKTIAHQGAKTVEPFTKSVPSLRKDMLVEKMVSRLKKSYTTEGDCSAV